jgi:ketosteroid isomerase-like protein
MKTALTLLLLSVAAYASDASTDEKDILATLAMWKQAALKGDAATLDKLFHPDLTYAHNNAKVENKQQAIAGAISPATKSKAIEYHDLTTRVYGSTAVTHGEFDITTATGNFNRLDVLIVWLKGPQGWQFLARHSAKIPDAPSANGK